MTKLKLTADDALPIIDIKNPHNQNRWNYIFLILTIPVLLFFLVDPMRRILTGHYMDFYHFYQAARAIMLGGYLYESGVGGYIYPPFFAFVLEPIGHLSYVTACLVWIVVNFSLIIVALLAGSRALALSFQITLNRWQTMIVCLLAILLTREQIHRELIQGQSDAVVLAGFALALLWIERKPMIAGALLGFIALIKYQAIFFLPFLLFRGRWKVVIALIIGALVAALLPALAVGWDRNLEYLAIAYRGVTHMDRVIPLSVHYAAQVPEIAWAPNISITSGLTRVFQDYGLPKSTVLIPVTIIAGAVFYYLWRLFQSCGVPFVWRTPLTLGNKQKETAVMILEWCALLVCMLVFSPQCIKRHTLLLLIVYLLAVILVMFPRLGIKRWAIVAGIIIGQLGFDFGQYFPKFGWNHIGGPTWTLLPFLMLLIWGALPYCRNVDP